MMMMTMSFDAAFLPLLLLLQLQLFILPTPVNGAPGDFPSCQICPDGTIMRSLTTALPSQSQGDYTCGEADIAARIGSVEDAQCTSLQNFAPAICGCTSITDPTLCTQNTCFSPTSWKDVKDAVDLTVAKQQQQSSTSTIHLCLCGSETGYGCTTDEATGLIVQDIPVFVPNSTTLSITCPRQGGGNGPNCLYNCPYVAFLVEGSLSLNKHNDDDDNDNDSNTQPFIFTGGVDQPRIYVSPVPGAADAQIYIRNTHFVNTTNLYSPPPDANWLSQTTMGGSIYNDGASSMTIINSKFERSEAQEDGGAIYIRTPNSDDSTNNIVRNISIQDSTFIANSAPNGDVLAIDGNVYGQLNVVIDSCEFQGHMGTAMFELPTTAANISTSGLSVSICNCIAVADDDVVGSTAQQQQQQKQQDELDKYESCKSDGGRW
eukprot:CAMPEP_0198147204 /NCGR_PEP_ID=MMETSP1443-20131203/33790_1 /TAXON_ID=186043 /ORGANISM="Entomoneis sp., Strain CCMP2396" /LENGTH=431 /DNA_ID=CAMNT_0043811407 /DNA_START=37 /DNA_END=1329 /DNA_ORIENTATION=+